MRYFRPFLSYLVFEIHGFFTIIVYLISDKPHFRLGGHMWLVVIILDNTALYFVNKCHIYCEFSLKTGDMTIAILQIYREAQRLEKLPELDLDLKSRCTVSNFRVLFLSDSLNIELIKIKDMGQMIFCAPVLLQASMEAFQRTVGELWSYLSPLCKQRPAWSS